MPKRRPSAVSRNLRSLSHTLISKAEVNADPGSLANSIAQKMGLPVLDPIRFEYAPLPSEVLEKEVNVVIKSSGTFYSHPHLQGIEFERDAVDLAISLVVAADRVVIMDEDSTPDVDLLGYLGKDPAFQRASFAENREEQMMIALHNVAVMTRQLQLLEADSSLDPADAEARARDDVATARTHIFDYREADQGRTNSDSLAPEAKRLLDFHRSYPGSDISDYELVLKIMNTPAETTAAELAASFDPTDSASEISLVNGLDPAAILETFHQMEREIVVAVLKKENGCTADDVSTFMTMHPGTRELRVRNFLDSLWPEHISRGGQVRYGDAKKSLDSKCALEEPTVAQKMEAITELSELSDNQKDVICSFFQLKQTAINPGSVKNFGTLAIDPSRRDAMLDLWKKDRIDLLTLVSLVHSRRFTDTAYHPPEEETILTRLEQGPNLEGFLQAFTKKTDERNGGDYYPEIRALFEVFPSVTYSSLAAAARRKSEANTLLEFFGVPVERAKVTFEYKNTSLVPEITGDKDGSPVYKDPCEDVMSSMIITFEDGEKIMLDAVFDGMGGHGNGARAARIAKDVLEISAMAGWIKTAEDVRKAIVAADLSILAEQWESKHVKSSLKRENDMGTTAVVAFQCGEEFHGIHCGDSEYRIIRGGETVFKSESHNFKYTIRRDGQDPDNPALKNVLRAHRSVVVSALGSGTMFININNVEGEKYSPFMLLPADVISADSDGITDPLCADHEYPKAIAKSASLAKAREEILYTCILRPTDRLYQPDCSCEPRQGKNDDKSLMLRYAVEGMESPVDSVARTITENPQTLSTSPDFLDLLTASLLEDEAQAETLCRKLILAAEAAEEKPAAYAFVIAVLFGGVSTRGDNDELVESLLPSMQGWTEAMVSELETCGGINPAKRAIFDFVSRTAEPPDFAKLLHARNSKISGWASQRLAEMPKGERIDFYKACFEKMPPALDAEHQTDVEGVALEPWQTRHLDGTVLDIYDSTVVQDTALRLGIRPRDLEIMLFYVYSDTDPDAVFDTNDSRFDLSFDAAVEMHNRNDFSQTLADLCSRMESRDAASILRASYYIYHLGTGSLEPDKAVAFSGRLSTIVKKMNPSAPYWSRFSNKVSLFNHRTSMLPPKAEEKE